MRTMEVMRDRKPVFEDFILLNDEKGCRKHLPQVSHRLGDRRDWYIIFRTGR